MNAQRIAELRDRWYWLSPSHTEANMLLDEIERLRGLVDRAHVWDTTTGLCSCGWGTTPVANPNGMWWSAHAAHVAAILDGTP